jgi:hypothetical protein
MIALPWPSAKLSGHGNGSWYDKRREIKKHRDWAYAATLAAMPSVPTFGDIPVHFRFVPPDRRSDRMNFANRLKPYADGIADALGVNDVRFLPSYEFCAPEKPGRVEVFIPANQQGTGQAFSCCSCQNVPQIERPGATALTVSGPDHNRLDKETI